MDSLANGSVLQDILEISKKLGYQTNYWLINSENFGVPQRRKRVIFVGAKGGYFSLIDSLGKPLVTLGRQ